ncbi:alkyl hydroperoxide reductase/ Thiol specific antioxidant/ Mal allergen [Gluconacetobacter diazotrophicus PA1 5]|uniref:Alkyl hydroperoxide reductase n=1 Tax=Gluconacetobacter diazotrophicus TaxID=33996 RepID=A0A7W4I657_GLUDI|nr:thioredoxin-like domain-containing protein [Gluconacetobacter diazotrophicus]ACI52094.1 alkyl hydroperoxide reductase/ Thiol specific antioxidant/ Mal allergen [Gluconacetobacter diazotrophicus PA1 5]MBB2156968.1 alkyl hydroperoxide reductase [Gluconacetobacter diazotrophicus]TWB02803.1 methylamine dehydrogenase accessory protein MauD [Gluconacetobacter diazotrophicus]
MMTALIVSQILLFAAIVVLVLVVLALARQIGVLHERIAPIGLQQPQSGLDVGQVIPRITMRTLSGAPFPMGEALPPGTVRMLLFVAPDCPVCKRVLPVALDVARDRGLDPVLVGDGAPPELVAMRDRMGLGGVAFVTGVELGLVLQVSRLPTLVLLDSNGTILAKDVVNTRRQVEALIPAAAGRAA